MYKTVFFLPVMATLLAMAIVWEFALHPVMGVVNDVLERGCSVGWAHSLLTGGWLVSMRPGAGTGAVAPMVFPSGSVTRSMPWERLRSSGSGRRSASTWCCTWPG